MFKIFFIAGITTLFLISCSSIESVESPSNQTNNLYSVGAFTPAGQLAAADYLLYAVLSPTGRFGSAPIIEMNRSETLTLMFETAGFESRQFVISFTHHNPDWSRSSIPAEYYMEGLYEFYLSGGEVNRNDAFRYRQFSFAFPNNDIRFRFSGNYMLRVEDTDTGNLVFTLPFFVYENEGNIRASIQTDFTGRNGRRVLHRPVARYRAPDFAELPQFDLLFMFTQNRFWGRSRIVSGTDFSNRDQIRFELDAESAFIGNYEFRTLNLGNLSQLNPDIDEIIPTDTPVTVTLDEDIVGQSDNTPFASARQDFGPQQSLNSRYVGATFRLETEQVSEASETIYLTGDFNNWGISENLKLEDKDESGFRTVHTLLKQGMYRYKYIVLDGETIDDNRFSSGFSDTIQHYHAFVYFRDPETRAFRLLQVLQFTGQSR